MLNSTVHQDFSCDHHPTCLQVTAEQQLVFKQEAYGAFMGAK